MADERVPRLLKRTDNGEVFPYNPYLLDRKDIAWEFIFDEPTEEGAQAPADARAAAIKAAVNSIDPKTYATPKFGRPAMPLLGDVAAITGFPVTSEEVLTALQP